MASHRGGLAHGEVGEGEEEQRADHGDVHGKGLSFVAAPETAPAHPYLATLAICEVMA